MELDTDISANICLDHLIPAARQSALLPEAERVARARADRWIGYPRAQAILKKLEELYTHPDRQRMPNLLIVGPTNNGKSTIIEKFRRQYYPFTSDDGQYEVIPVAYVQMPSDPNIARFYTMLLFSLNVPDMGHKRVHVLEGLCLRVMQQVGARMLVIDEIHNLLAGGRSHQREFLNLIRFLGNQLRIPIIGVGTRDAYLAIRSDDQLENRFEPMPLPVWRDDQDFRSLLASFASVLPLRRASDLSHPDLSRLILAKSEGIIGEMNTLLTRAAVDAIQSGEDCITRRTLEMTGYQSPTERKSTFEREIA